MKRLVVATLLAFALLVVPLRGATHPLQNSVFPLAMQVNGDDGIWANICTVSSINPAHNLFMTAAHCVLDKAGHVRANLVVGEELNQAVVQRADPTKDIAILWANQPAVAVGKLRTKPLQFKDELQIPSFQLGWWVFMLTTGRVTNPDAIIKGDTKAYMWHDVYGCGGSSGSPILDKDGNLVSIEQVGARAFEPCSGVGGGATLEQMKDFAKYFPK